MRKHYPPHEHRQAGVATVEMALCCLIFFTLVFGIIEFGRMLFVYNTMQEVTRRAAREATIRWVDKTSIIKNVALFGSSSVPGAPEITASNVTIRYLTAAGTAVTTYPTDPGDNMSACNDVTRTNECIRSVSVSLENVTYVPMLSMFGYLSIPMPTTTVVMYAESLGFND